MRNDICPCGAAVNMDLIDPDMVGWVARCYAGHRLFLADLHEPGVIVDDIETVRT